MLRTEPGQEIGHLAGSPRQFRITEPSLAAGLFDDVQGWRRVVARDGVEIIERPVESVERRPLERRKGAGVVGTVGQQQVTAG
jgi:alkylated DNA nucleotide flippase Atl1